MLIRTRPTGFSLIEMLVGLVILALLLTFGMPQYAIFLANAKLRATTDNLVSGLQTARAEAVKRNARVELLLTDDDPIPIMVNAASASTSGINWMVREYVPATDTHNFIEGRLGMEGSGQVDATPVTITSNSTDASYDGRISFNGFGALSTAQTITFQITNPSGGACDTVAVRGPMRCLNVNVSPGGQIRVCDPKIPVTDTKDTRVC